MNNKISQTGSGMIIMAGIALMDKMPSYGIAIIILGIVMNISDKLIDVIFYRKNNQIVNPNLDSGLKT